MDFGAEYANYASDLTRTIPINGQFTKRQRQIYDSVRRVMVKAIEMLEVGNILDGYHKEVCKIMEYELIGLGLFGLITLDPRVFAENFAYFLTIVAGLYFLYLYVFAGLSDSEKKNLLLLFVLFIGAAAFWSGFDHHSGRSWFAG